MKRRFHRFLLPSVAAAASIALAAPASAFDGVVASIKPVHSLVAAVMDGAGEPSLIVRGAGSGHTHALRPSDAQALEDAKIVFWIGPDMETFLRAPLETLARDAEIVALADTTGLTRLEFRQGGPFEAHAHDHGHHDHGDEDDHDGHSHGHYDMHVWLDPENAKLLLAEIERTLAEADPANAALYRDNAEAYARRLDALAADVETTLAPVKERPVVVFHDAYQYFEQRFGINVVGSITVSPEVMPGAQRIDEIRTRVQELDAACIFTEPQFEPRLVSVVAEGTGARTGVLDPLGAELEDGPDLYPELIRTMATSLQTCLSGEG